MNLISSLFIVKILFYAARIFLIPKKCFLVFACKDISIKIKLSDAMKLVETQSWSLMSAIELVKSFQWTWSHPFFMLDKFSLVKGNNESFSTYFLSSTLPSFQYILQSYESIKKFYSFKIILTKIISALITTILRFNAKIWKKEIYEFQLKKFPYLKSVLFFSKLFTWKS